MLGKRSAVSGRLIAHLLLCVGKYDGLRDGEGVVEVTERVELPLFPLHCHKELLDALRVERRISSAAFVMMSIRDQVSDAAVLFTQFMKLNREVTTC